MKGAVFKILVGVAVCALALFALRSVAGSTSYEKMVRDQFGSPEAIRALAALYEHVEADGHTLRPAAAKRRLIPQSWIPTEFAEAWRIYYDLDVNEVVAHFDDSGSLIAIEFDGSRCGCFVSRYSSRCPSSFDSLHRLATAPLYVTGRVGEKK